MKNYEIMNGNRVGIMVDGVMRRGAMNEIDGVWLMAIRGEPLEIGKVVSTGPQRWVVTKRRISTIRHAHLYVVEKG